MSQVGAFFDVDRTLVVLQHRPAVPAGPAAARRDLVLPGAAGAGLDGQVPPVADRPAVGGRPGRRRRWRGWVERDFAERCRRWVEDDVLPLIVPGRPRRDRAPPRRGARAGDPVVVADLRHPADRRGAGHRGGDLDPVRGRRRRSSPAGWSGPACVGQGKVHWAEDLGARRAARSRRRAGSTPIRTPTCRCWSGSATAWWSTRTRACKRAAKRRGWPVQDWRQAAAPAAARRRPARERLFGPLVHAGGAAAAGPGAGGGRRPRRRDHRSRSSTRRRKPRRRSSPRERAVVCGLGVVEAVFTRFDWRTRVRMKVADGDPVAPGDGGGDRARAGGGAAGRRADGAELPAAPVGDRHADPGVRGARPRAPSCASPTRARRRPGCGALEKYAVRVGGGVEPPRRPGVGHPDQGQPRRAGRLGARGGPAGARQRAAQRCASAVEVDTLAQLDEAIEAGAEGILLDNFQVRDMAEAVKRVRERRPQHGDRGVGRRDARPHPRDQQDRRRRHLRSASLTHSARAINFSCEIRPVEGARARRLHAQPSLAGPPPLDRRVRRRSMDEAALARALHTRWLGRAFEWHARVRVDQRSGGRARRGPGAPAGLVIVADAQTGGRGRLGRSWHSPAGREPLLLDPAAAGAAAGGDPAAHAAGGRGGRGRARGAWPRSRG